MFKEPETRDTVFGASSMLACKIDPQGLPTAGLRIEVPRSLKGPFTLLRRYGQQLKARHGQGLKRHIKFDDVQRSLYLNVKLPGDQRWSKASVELARRGLLAHDRNVDNDLERRFDIGGERPRSVSLSGGNAAPIAGSSQTQTWTGRRTESSSE